MMTCHQIVWCSIDILDGGILVAEGSHRLILLDLMRTSSRCNDLYLRM